MRRLTYLYLAQHWKRDAALLAMMPVVALAIYIFYRYNGSYTGLAAYATGWRNGGCLDR